MKPHRRTLNVGSVSIFMSALFLALPTSLMAAECEAWIAQILSAQGQVNVVRAGSSLIEVVDPGETKLCPGDTLRAGALSKATLLLANQTRATIDESTEFTLPQTASSNANCQRAGSSNRPLLELLKGAIRFISRTSTSLEICAPYVNAAIEGTEFVVRAKPTENYVWVSEGRVLASNSQGSLALKPGEGVVALAGAPLRRITVKPEDATQWSLYYPPVIDYRAEVYSTGPAAPTIAKAIADYRRADLEAAFAKLGEVPEASRNAEYYSLRAGLLLSAGRVEEALADTKQALRIDPAQGVAYALQSIVAVTQNRSEQALALAQKAQQLDSVSSVPQIALSYAYQAGFEIEKARGSVRRAVVLSPEDALAWSRLAELELSMGDLDKALAAAEKAEKLDSDLARTQNVLGFSHLLLIDIGKAKTAFRKAINLDPSDPLPYLGLGLATIRQGDLDQGTKEIETAAILDPDNSLTRSYLGKAYYEQKHIKLAETEFASAKELDPNDPTPYFYDAILKQTVNQPAQALRELRTAIELNGNRAVYRSRFLLDQDQASRTANVARVYSDLGVQQRALQEGWESVNRDPSNHSAHRFLADTYSALPRHEVARASELLQTQLLQPINITPLQPQQNQTNAFILDGAGPGNLSFNEFNPLFARNRTALQAAGISGSDGTFGDELILSGLYDRLSASLGQFHFETDGFRENSDFEQDIQNAFVQAALTPQHNLQIQFDHKKIEAGDTTQRINPAHISSSFRRDVEDTNVRVGYHFKAAVNTDVLASFIFRDGKDSFDRQFAQSVAQGNPPFLFEENQDLDSDAYTSEVQYLLSMDYFNFTLGAGYYRTDDIFSNGLAVFFDDQFRAADPVLEKFTIKDYNAYLYSQINYPSTFTWIIGFSADFHDDERANQFDSNQFNPKLGLIWAVTPNTSLRAAGFRLLRQPLAANRTIQPTQIAGFNQFFDDFNGSDVYRYGVGLDHKFTLNLLGGFEFSRSYLDVPTQVVTDLRDLDFFSQSREENLGRAYLYWIPANRFALSAEYYFEDLNRDSHAEFDFADDPQSVRTHRLPIGVNYYHSSGLFTRWTASYIEQDVEFAQGIGEADKLDSNFWLVDAGIGYRTPKRWGIASLTVKNLLDKDFGYQNTDVAGNPRSPLFQPEASVFLNFSLAL